MRTKQNGRLLGTCTPQSQIEPLNQKSHIAQEYGLLPAVSCPAAITKGSECGQQANNNQNALAATWYFCIRLTWQLVKTHVIKFCAFHFQWKSKQMLTPYIQHTCTSNPEDQDCRLPLNFSQISTRTTGGFVSKQGQFQFCS